MIRLRGTTILLAIITLGAVFLFISSTGAVVLDTSTDPITDGVALQPGDNPYTYLDDDGELVIDVTEDNPNLDGGGVNPDGFVAEDALFYVAYDANTTGEVWIEHDSKAVTFVVDGKSIENGKDPLFLTPEDEAVPVGVEVDTRVIDVVPGNRLVDEITVHAQPAEPEAIPDDGLSGGAEDDDDASEPTVTVESPEETTRRVEVKSVAPNDKTEIDLSDLHVGGPSIRLDELSFV
ncbi:hypothetical protein DJ68_13545, partial [Halorubrum sp. C3]